MWITSLRSDTEERVVTFRSRLEAQKAVSDQDVARNLDDLGAEVDQRNLEFMAAAGAASDRLRMQKIEKHPKRLQDVAAVQAAQAEAVAEVRQREQKMIQHFKEKYGIDPTESSFFHYTDAPGGGAPGGPTKGTF
jgi:cytidylate kinase